MLPYTTFDYNSEKMESVRSAINFDKEKLSGMKVLMIDDTPSNLDILGLQNHCRW